MTWNLCRLGVLPDIQQRLCQLILSIFFSNLDKDKRKQKRQAASGKAFPLLRGQAAKPATPFCRPK
ncbi:hypothetical protein HBN76_08380 [Pseudomonas sp. WS 5013]|uniref:hypothetical protein n=1 Tax=Pseudomonas sp. WS 5013 TaxID=2717475 RepID=UPI0014763604|nr:hypothetical protein [Pseudomonas sp. WS 5013]NMY41319.1 hypothetical protein [Pseudomonas sp. WS 5013]